MRFFHISDLHIGKQLYRYSLLEDQAYMLQQIVGQIREKRPDAVLISGDIYDRSMPGSDAVALFDRFLTSLAECEPAIAVLLIAGNHDSASRIDYAGNILRREQIYIAGSGPQKPEDRIEKVVLTDAYGEVDFYLLPFVRPGQLRGLFSEEENESFCNLAKETGRSEYDIYFEKLLMREDFSAPRRRVLLTHQYFRPLKGEIRRSDSEIVTVGLLDEIATCHLKPFDYVAMGHIHRPQKCGEPYYRYCGSPMPYSVSEEKDEKAILSVTLGEKGTPPEIEQIPIIPLRRVRKLSGTKQELLDLAERESGENGKVEDYVNLIVWEEHPGRFLQEELEEHFSHILEIEVANEQMREHMECEDADETEMDYPSLFEVFFQKMYNREMCAQEKETMLEMMKRAEEEPE